MIINIYIRYLPINQEIPKGKLIYYSRPEYRWKLLLEDDSKQFFESEGWLENFPKDYSLSSLKTLFPELENIQISNEVNIIPGDESIRGEVEN